MRSVERLTTSDLAMLVPDEFGWPQDITAVAIVEGDRLLGPRGKLRIDLIRQAVARRLHRVPRFRQLLIEPAPGLGVPYWIDAPRFDIADHVRMTQLPRGAGEPELLAAFETLRARAFDGRRPLWEMWLLPGLASGNVGLVIKVHHTLAGGVGGVATLATLLDPQRDAAATNVVPWQPRALPRWYELLFDNVRRRLAELARPLRALLHPLRTVRWLRRVTPVVREMASEAKAPRTSLNSRLVGDHRRLLVIRSRLDRFEAIAHAHGVTLDDVVLTIVASGLRELLLERCEDVADLVLHVAVESSVHGNANAVQVDRDSGMIVRVPIGDVDDVHRLHAIAADTVKREKHARPQLAGVSFPGVLTLLRAIYKRMSHQRTANICVANVSGPSLSLYLAGARLVEIVSVVPLTGNQPLAVGALSYAGQLAISVVSDPDACPDVALFAGAMQRSLDALAAEVRTRATAA